MSTYWGYRCETCHVDSPHWFNHGEGLLQEVAEKWPDIRAALTLVERVNLQHVEIDVRPLLYQNTGTVDEDTLWEFFLKHGAHSLVLLNEYGDTRPLPNGTGLRDGVIAGRA